MQDPTHFTVKVRVGVGNIRGTAEIKMELAEAMRPQRAQYKGQGTAVGSQITISAGFDLRPQRREHQGRLAGRGQHLRQAGLDGGRHAGTAGPQEHSEAD